MADLNESMDNKPDDINTGESISLEEEKGNTEDIVNEKNLEDLKPKITDIDKILGAPENESDSDTEEIDENGEKAVEPEIKVGESEPKSLVDINLNQVLEKNGETDKKDESVLDSEVHVESGINVNINESLKTEISDVIESVLNDEIQIDKCEVDISVNDGIKLETNDDTNKVENLVNDIIQIDKSDIESEVDISVNEDNKIEINEDISKEVESKLNTEIQIDEPYVESVSEDTNTEIESNVSDKLQIKNPDFEGGIDININESVKIEMNQDINKEIDGAANDEIKSGETDIECDIGGVKLECGFDISGNPDVSIDLKNDNKFDVTKNLELDLNVEAETPNIGFNLDVNINDLNKENVCDDIHIGDVISDCDATVGFELNEKEQIGSPDISLNLGLNASAGESIVLELPHVESKSEVDIEISLPEMSRGGEFIPSLGPDAPEIDTDISISLPEVDVENAIVVDISAVENSQIEVPFPDLGFYNVSDECPKSIDLKAEVPNIGIQLDGNTRHNNNVNLEFRTEVEPKMDHTGDIHKSKECSSTLRLKEADIHILVDLDEISKKAIFRIDMAESWSKEVVDKDDEHYSLDLKAGSKLNLGNGIDSNSRRKDKLNVEIGMFIGKENLEDSTVYACINSKSIGGSRQYESDIPQKSHKKSSESDTSPDIRPKRYDFRFQLPKIEFPLFGSKSTDGASSTDTEKRTDVDVTQPESSVTVDEPPKRYDFRFQLPKLDFLSFENDVKSVHDNEVVAFDVNKQDTSASVDVKESLQSPPKRYDFRYQLPNIDFTLFGTEETSEEDDKERNLQQSTEAPERKIHITIEDRQQHANVDGPKVAAEGNIENGDKNRDYNFHLPKVELDKSKEKSYMEEDLDTRKSDIEPSLSSIESPTKRYDFRFQLPKLELPSLVWKPNSHNAVSDVNIDTNVSFINADLEVTSSEGVASHDDHPKRYDFRFQLPKIDLFGDKNISPTASEVNAGINDKDKVSKVEIEVEYDQNRSEIDGDVKLKGDSENRTPTKRYDFRFQLPKLGLPSFDDKDHIEVEPESEVLLKIPDIVADSEAETRRYNFSFSFPENKFCISKGQVQFPTRSGAVDDDHNEFSFVFDGGDCDRGDTFEIKLEYGLLKCRECYNGDWQPEITSNVKCVSPKKNLLVAVLPLRGDGPLLVLFNDEILVKYSLKGRINTLQSFTINGAVKLNSVTLCEE